MIVEMIETQPDQSTQYYTYTSECSLESIVSAFSSGENVIIHFPQPSANIVSENISPGYSAAMYSSILQISILEDACIIETGFYELPGQIGQELEEGGLRCGYKEGFNLNKLVFFGPRGSDSPK